MRTVFRTRTARTNFSQSLLSYLFYLFLNTKGIRVILRLNSTYAHSVPHYPQLSSHFNIPVLPFPPPANLIWHLKPPTTFANTIYYVFELHVRRFTHRDMFQVTTIVTNDHWSTAGVHGLLICGDEKVCLSWRIPHCRTSLSLLEKSHLHGSIASQVLVFSLFYLILKGILCNF